MKINAPTLALSVVALATACGVDTESKTQTIRDAVKAEEAQPEASTPQTEPNPNLDLLDIEATLEGAWHENGTAICRFEGGRYYDELYKNDGPYVLLSDWEKRIFIAWEPADGELGTRRIFEVKVLDDKHLLMDGFLLERSR